MTHILHMRKLSHREINYCTHDHTATKQFQPPGSVVLERGGDVWLLRWEQGAIACS